MSILWFRFRSLRRNLALWPKEVGRAYRLWEMVGEGWSWSWSYKAGTGCEAGDKCLVPHHEVDKQPNKKPKKSHHSHKGRESDDKNAVAIVKIVPQLGCVSQDSESLDSQRRKTVPGKPAAKSLGTDSKKTIHQVFVTSSWER